MEFVLLVIIYLLIGYIITNKYGSEAGNLWVVSPLVLVGFGLLLSGCTEEASDITCLARAGNTVCGPYLECCEVFDNFNSQCWYEYNSPDTDESTIVYCDLWDCTEANRQMVNVICEGY